jgi:hypothetical protein
MESGISQLSDGAGMSVSATDATMERLEDQISWYDRKSASSQRWFKSLKASVMVLAAIIPFSAGLGWSAYVTGGLGVAIVVLEGLPAQLDYLSLHLRGLEAREIPLPRPGGPLRG